MRSWKAAVAAAFDIFDRVTVDPAPPSRDDGDSSAAAVIRSSMEDPIGDLALSQRLSVAQRVTVVVPDASCSVSETTLRVIIEHLDAFTTRGADVRALVATDWRSGPGSTATSDLAHLRLFAQHQIPVVIHDRRDARSVGVVTIDGTSVPVELNPLVLDADLVVIAEPVELSWGSGLGGGYRSIARGVAGHNTLHALDRLACALPDSMRTRIARSHPIHAAWARVAAAAAPCFAVFETVTATSRAYVSGEPSMALEVLVERPGSPWYADVDAFDGIVMHIPVREGCSALDGFAQALSLLDHPRAPLHEGAPALIILAGQAAWRADDAHQTFVDAVHDRPNERATGDGTIAARTLARRVTAVSQRHPLHLVAPADVPDLGELVQRHRDTRDGCEGLALHMNALASTDAHTHAALVRDLTVRLPLVPRTMPSLRRPTPG